MPTPFVLQSKFLSLLAETSSFFTIEEVNPEQDRETVHRLRSGVLDLVASPQDALFERFLAYLLGTRSIESEYPLQAIRMACVSAQLLKRIVPAVPDTIRKETIVAAYLADFGFRAAWLGQQGTHTEIAITHLQAMGLPWYTSSLERSMALAGGMALSVP